jgi:hypothetical protein
VGRAISIRHCRRRRRKLRAEEGSAARDRLAAAPRRPRRECEACMQADPRAAPAKLRWLCRNRRNNNINNTQQERKTKQHKSDYLAEIGCSRKKCITTTIIIDRRSPNHRSSIADHQIIDHRSSIIDH